MDVATLQGLIGQLGFPIVMCLILQFNYKKTIDKLSATVEANTKVMLVIATKQKLDVNENGVNS